MAGTVTWNILGVANDYVRTISGTKEFVFKPIKLALEIFHHAGKQSRLSENAKSLVSDALDSLAIAEIGPKIYDVASKAANFAENSNLFTGGNLVAKTVYCASTIFKAAAYLARKGVTTWDTVLLKTWASRFNVVYFSWNIFKEGYTVATGAVDTVRKRQEKNLSLIKLAVYISLFTISAFGAFGAIIPSALSIGLSTVVLLNTISWQFYEKLNGLDRPLPNLAANS